MPVHALDDATLATVPKLGDRQAVDIEMRLAHAASMRLVYTFTEYAPRHRAAGPAV